MRIIDADRLNKEIKSRFGYYSATAFVRNIQNLSQVDVFKHIMRLIEEAPTIEKRPAGKWRLRNNKYYAGGGYYFCNKCNQRYSFGGYFELDNENYCPNCGADMKGAEE